MTPATDLILHHEATSPFCEKIRRVLGHKQLAWKSVEAPALAGGPLPLPVLQVGADLYGDSALICEVLEHVRPEPPLYPPHLRGVSRVFAQWADVDLLRAVRQAALASGDALSAYRSYLRRIASMVEEHDFLFGADPCVADFATFGPLWFARQHASALADILAITPAVGEWMDRLSALGQGRPEPWLAEAACTVAERHEPRPPGDNLLIDSGFQDDHGIALGERVAISAEGNDGTEGELVAATRTHYTLRRTEARAGTVHVHLPRIGYRLRRITAA